MDLKNINVEELTCQETFIIEGGDKFMHNLGVLVGTIVGWLEDTWEAGSSGTEYAPKF